MAESRRTSPPAMTAARRPPVSGDRVAVVVMQSQVAPARRRARGSATCVHFGGSPPGGVRISAVPWVTMRRRLLYTLLALAAAALRDRRGRAAAHRARPRPARRRRRAAGPAAGARRVGRARRRRADPRPRGVFFPAEIVNATAGLAFGFWVAFPLVLVSWVAVRADRRTGSGGRRAPARGAAGGGEAGRERRAADRPLAARPRCCSRGSSRSCPFSLVGYLAGAARVPVWRYTWTTFVGVLPITAARRTSGTRSTTSPRRTRCCGSRSA